MFVLSFVAVFVGASMLMVGISIRMYVYMHFMGQLGNIINLHPDACMCVQR